MENAMLNVLVVDDSSVTRSMIIRILRMSRMPLGEVFEAGNGEEGLRLLESHKIDLALIDVHMPLMDGEEMVGRLRGNGRMKDLAVLFVTSESNPMRVDGLLERGAAVIRKPFTPEMLRRAVDEAAGGGDATGR
jgi:two-component system, chemotaxis family, chemotaxis protein CheY